MLCSDGIALIMAWLIPLAPWLPPITSKVGDSRLQPKFLERLLAIDPLQGRSESACR